MCSEPAQLLLDAWNAMHAGKLTVVVDGGVENDHAAVNKMVESGRLTRALAQTEIRSSISLIESWWRVLKHQGLYLNQLDAVRTTDVVAIDSRHRPRTLS